MASMISHMNRHDLRFKLFSHISILFLLFYHSGLNNGPDRLEKDLGSLLETNPSAAKIDWYSSAVIKDSNVYMFYGRFIKSLEFLPINTEFLRISIFLLLQIFSYYLVLRLSQKITNSQVPGQLYAATVCILPSFWVNPEFLGYDGGLSPRTFSTTFLLLAITLVFHNRDFYAFVAAGLACLFHPSHGLLVFAIVSTSWIVGNYSKGRIGNLVRRALTFFGVFIFSGGFFPIVLARRINSNSTPDQYSFHASLITNFRHPFMPVDYSKVIYVFIMIITIVICSKYLELTRERKTLVFSLSFVSSFLIILFWIGVEFSYWLLVSLFAFRLETVISFFAILLFFSASIKLLENYQLNKQLFLTLSFILLTLATVYKMDFASPNSRVSFQSNFLSGAATHEELAYAWGNPRCFISPPGSQFPFSVAQFKVIGFAPIAGNEWFSRLSLVSNVDLAKKYSVRGKFNQADMSEVQTTLDNGFRSLTASRIREISTKTNCDYVFLPRDYRYLEVIKNAPNGFFQVSSGRD